MTTRHTFCAVAALLFAIAVHVDIVVDMSPSTTGPPALLGTVQKNSLAFRPDTIGGEKPHLVVADDASDPSTDTCLARKLVMEDHVNIIVGSSAVVPSIAIAEVATKSHMPQLASAPVGLKPDRDDQIYRLAQPVPLMAETTVTRMAASGIKGADFISFTDAYGESWLKDFATAVTSRDVKIVDVERCVRIGTSVAGQVAKLVSIKSDAVLVAGAGTDAALLHIALCGRGHVGSIYQMHGVTMKDLIRIGGKAVDGAIPPTGPVIVAE